MSRLPHRWIVALCLVLIPTSSVFGSLPVEPAEIQHALSLLPPTKGWSIGDKQRVAADSQLWSTETLEDGSEIFTARASSAELEHKRVILRDGANVSSISFYILTKSKSSRGPAHEESASIVFHKGRLHALTKCSDNGDKSGRDCLTVSRLVCGFVKAPEADLPKALNDELKVLEVRALATILTLRGAEHQLENVSRHGGRMGLKDPLQTTKGKLTAKDGGKRARALDRARELCRLSKLD